MVYDLILDQNSTDPFFMMLCPTAPHLPYSYLPIYNMTYTDRVVPRQPYWNHHSSDKHWIVSQTPVDGMPQWVIDGADRGYRSRLRSLLSVDKMIDNIFQWVIDGADRRYRSRLRSLLSVDKMIDNIFQVLEQKNLLDETYIIYTSDNGYHLGQFVLPVGKGQPYEFDTRVPLAIRGPGVPVQRRSELVANIDLGATVLDLANIVVPENIDGQSFQPLAQPETAKRNWSREKLLIEYWGAGEPQSAKGCPNTQNEYCAASYGCICLDATNNTYSCVRTLSREEDSIYCEFADEVHFSEFYDFKKDPYQMVNAVKQLKPPVLQKHKKDLRGLKFCQGNACRNF